MLVRWRRRVDIFVDQMPRCSIVVVAMCMDSGVSMPMPMDVGGGNRSAAKGRIKRISGNILVAIVLVIIVLGEARFINLCPTCAQDGERHGKVVRLANRLFAFPIRSKIDQRKCFTRTVLAKRLGDDRPEVGSRHAKTWRCPVFEDRE